MKKSIVKIFFVMIFVMMVYASTSLAGYISNDVTITSGQTFAITVQSTETLENYDMSLSSYSGLTYVSCSASNGAVANSASGAISYANISGTTNLGTYTFKAPEVSTTSQYQVIFKINGDNNANVSNITVNPQTQQEQPTQSNNQQPKPSGGELSSITVNGKTYNNPNQDITISVGNEVENTTVSAVSSDGTAVTGTGNVALKVGTNLVKLTTGGTTYIVRITRQAKIEETPPNIIDETEEQQEQPKETLALNSLEVEGYDLSPKFSKDVFSYTINIDMEKNDIKKLNITALANREDAKVEIIGNENLKEGENIINVTITSADEAETVTYQLKVNKIISSTEVVGKTKLDDANQELTNTTKMSRTTQIIVVAIAIIGAVAGIIFAIVEYRYTNKKTDDEYQYNEPFYIKENSEGRLDIVDKEENVMHDNEEEDKMGETQDNQAEEEIDKNTESVFEDQVSKTPEEDDMGYIEELYRNNFSQDDLEKEIGDNIDKRKKKKTKGKHF